jgi:membrane protein implicated in regulation of membrane protease activity
VPRKYTPQEREARAREDYHDPTAGIGGVPPARSALTLRLILASFGLVACATGAVLFLTAVIQPAIAAAWAFFAAVALIDLVVVARRKLRGEPG